MRCPSPIEMLTFPLEQAFQLPFLGSMNRDCFCLKNRKSTQSTGNDVAAPAQPHACLLLVSSCDSCGFACPSSRLRRFRGRQ
jgi:hypothetical protein